MEKPSRTEISQEAPGLTEEMDRERKRRERGEQAMGAVSEFVRRFPEHQRQLLAAVGELRDTADHLSQATVLLPSHQHSVEVIQGRVTEELTAASALAALACEGLLEWATLLGAEDTSATVFKTDVGVRELREETYAVGAVALVGTEVVDAMRDELWSGPAHSLQVLFTAAGQQDTDKLHIVQLLREAAGVVEGLEGRVGRMHGTLTKLVT